MVGVRRIAVPEPSRGRTRVQVEHRADLVSRELVLFITSLIVPVQIAHAKAVLVERVKSVVVIGDGAVILDDGHLVLVPRKERLILCELVGVLDASEQDGGHITVVFGHTTSYLCVCEACHERRGVGGPS